MNIGISIVYLIKAVIFGIATVILIPKEQYKKYFIYGFFTGGVANVLVVSIFSYLNFIKYYNMGPFAVFDTFAFFTPIAWTFTMMLFLYFLPVRKVFFFPYVISFALFAVAVGEVLKGFGLYEYSIYLMPFVFIAWFSLTAFVYMRNEKIKLI